MFDYFGKLSAQISYVDVPAEILQHEFRDAQSHAVAWSRGQRNDKVAGDWRACSNPSSSVSLLLDGLRGSRPAPYYETRGWWLDWVGGRSEWLVGG